LAHPFPSAPSADGFPLPPGSVGSPWLCPAFPLSCPFRFAMAPCFRFLRPLFGDFVGTVGQSDSLLRSSMARVLGLPIAAHGTIRRGQMQGLPVLAHSASTHAQGLRPRQVPTHLAQMSVRWVLPSALERASAPGTSTRFRGSIPGLRVPRLTLRARPHGRVHIARGRRGWLALQRANPSFAALCRFIPALLPERVRR
jgi:hypothetical protein